MNACMIHTRVVIFVAGHDRRHRDGRTMPRRKRKRVCVSSPRVIHRRVSSTATCRPSPRLVIASWRRGTRGTWLPGIASIAPVLVFWRGCSSTLYIFPPRPFLRRQEIHQPLSERNPLVRVYQLSATFASSTQTVTEQPRAQMCDVCKTAHLKWWKPREHSVLLSDSGEKKRDHTARSHLDVEKFCARHPSLT